MTHIIIHLKSLITCFVNVRTFVRKTSAFLSPRMYECLYVRPCKQRTAFGQPCNVQTIYRSYRSQLLIQTLKFSSTAL
jgi:hypothetical protein